METTYTRLIPSANWLEEMKNTLIYTNSIFNELSEADGNFAYDKNKWTLKTILEHLIDCERVFVYRALRFSKNDNTPISSFDENYYASNEITSTQTLKQLIEEFQLTRQSSISFFSRISPQQLNKKGVSNGLEITVEHIGKHIVGHNIHHLNVIKERYLPKLSS